MKEVYYSTNFNGLHIWVESREHVHIVAEICDTVTASLKPYAESEQNDTKAFVRVSKTFRGLDGPAATEHRLNLIKGASDIAKKKIRALGFKPVPIN